MHIIHLLRSSTKVRGWKNKGRGIGCTAQALGKEIEPAFRKRVTSSFGLGQNCGLRIQMAPPCLCVQHFKERPLIHRATTQHNWIEKSWLGWDKTAPPPSTHGASFRAFRLAIFISKVTSFQVSVALFRQSPPFLSLNFFWQLQSPLHSTGQGSRL